MILCGSALSFMEKKVLSEKSPLFGRCDSQIKLEAFNYLDAAKFVPNYSNEDKAISNTVKGGDAFRLFAMCIAVAIAFFCTLGQGIDSWICFGVYLGVGVVIWLWMVLVNWKKHPVEIETPDGIQKF